MPPELAPPSGATPADRAYASARARPPRIGSLIPAPATATAPTTPDDSAPDWSVLVQRDDVNVAGFAARKFARHQRLWREYQARTARPPPPPPPPRPTSFGTAPACAGDDPSRPPFVVPPPTLSTLPTLSIPPTLSNPPAPSDLPDMPNPFDPTSPISPPDPPTSPGAGMATCADCGAEMLLDELPAHVCLAFNPASTSPISISSAGRPPAPDPAPIRSSRSLSPTASLWSQATPVPQPVLRPSRSNPHMHASPPQDIVALRKERIAVQRAAARSGTPAPARDPSDDDEQEGITFGLGLGQPPNDGLALRPIRRGTEPASLAPAPSPGPIRAATAPLGPARTTAEHLCSECEAPLPARRIAHLGRNWCKPCYAQHFLPRCPSCALPVEGQGVRSKDPSLEGVYHRACFKCSHSGCTAALAAGGEHYALRSKPYCGRHYHQEAGTLCQICDRGVEGAARVSQGAVYHQSCLVCQYSPDLIGQRGQNKRCSTPLDTFYQLGKKRFCEAHFYALAAHSSHSTATAEKRISVVRPLKY